MNDNDFVTRVQNVWRAICAFTGLSKREVNTICEASHSRFDSVKRLAIAVRAEDGPYRREERINIEPLANYKAVVRDLIARSYLEFLTADITPNAAFNPEIGSSTVRAGDLVPSSRGLLVCFHVERAFRSAGLGHDAGYTASEESGGPTFVSATRDGLFEMMGHCRIHIADYEITEIGPWQSRWWSFELSGFVAKDISKPM